MMKDDRSVPRPGHPRILIAIVDGERGRVVEQYQKDVEDLDPFELKKLLQNVCDRIMSEYRRDMLLGYAHVQSHDIAHGIESSHM